MAYAVPVTSFAEIEREFTERVRREPRCSVATLDTRDRPRSRVWHPIWEGGTGYIATRRHTLKTRHLAHNPYVSLAYVIEVWRPVYADCRAQWDDTTAGKQRVWGLFLNTPPPVGYDPAPLFVAPENPEFGVLKLDPWRIELVDGPGESRVWRA